MTERELIPEPELSLELLPPGRIRDDVASVLMFIRWQYARMPAPLTQASIRRMFPELPKGVLRHRLRTLQALGLITWHHQVPRSIRPSLHSGDHSTPALLAPHELFLCAARDPEP